MSFNFEIENNHNCEPFGKLWFKIQDKSYDFIFKICKPESGDMSKIYWYYFIYEYKNLCGGKLIYTDMANCFYTIASNIDSNNYLRVFNININNEFKKEYRQDVKELFIKINDCIINQIKKYYNLEDISDEPVYELNINDYVNDGEDEFEKETYYFDDVYFDCEGGFLNYMLCPTLGELFEKYNYNISKIKYSHIQFLEGDLKKYSIDYRGFDIGVIVVDYSDHDPENDIMSWRGKLKNFSLEQLLKLKVFIPSWNKFNFDKGIKFDENNITKKLYEIFKS